MRSVGLAIGVVGMLCSIFCIAYGGILLHAGHQSGWAELGVGILCVGMNTFTISVALGLDR